MDINGRKRRVAVLGKTGLVEPRHRDIFRHPTARLQQSFDHANRGQVIDGDHSSGPRIQLGNRKTGLQASCKSQITRNDGPGG